jgi:hypothetical protein
MLGAIGCGEDPQTVVFVTVNARAGVFDTETLEVIARNESSSASVVFDIRDRAFPVTFTVTPTDRMGQLIVEAKARDELDLLRGLGEASTTVLTDGQANVEVMLEPADFVVNTSVAGTQLPTFSGTRNGRQIATGADGKVMITFENDCSMLGRCDIFGRLFDTDGVPLANETAMNSNEFIVNLDESFNSVPAIAIGENSAFGVWESSDDIRGVALTPNGGHLTFSDTIISDVAATITDDGAVAALANDEYIVVWAQTRVGGGREIRGRLLGGNGNPVVNNVTGNDLDFAIGSVPNVSYRNPHVAASGVGREFVVVWEHDELLRGRFYGSNGTPVGIDVALASYTVGSDVTGPKVAMDSNGNAAVAWTAEVVDVTEFVDGAFFLARFAPPVGAPLGGTITLAAPAPNAFSTPVVAIGPNGVAGAAWHDCGVNGDGSGCGILFQSFDRNGVATSSPTIVNTTTIGDQEDPSIVSVNDAFMMVWADRSEQPPDTSDGAVRARLFFPPGGAAP